jgi:hypothetical protein
MSSHLGVQPIYFPSVLSKTQTELVIFRSNYVFVIPPCFLESLYPYHRVAATTLDFASRLIPLNLTYPVVKRQLWILLPNSAGDRRDIGALVQELFRLFNPIAAYLAVAIQELNDLQRRIMLYKVSAPGVSGARGGEWLTRRQFNCRDSERTCQRNAIIGRSRVDIHKRPIARYH